jgi:hypothetical protein
MGGGGEGRFWRQNLSRLTEKSFGLVREVLQQKKSPRSLRKLPRNCQESRGFPRSLEDSQESRGFPGVLRIPRSLNESRGSPRIQSFPRLPPPYPLPLNLVD